VVAAHGLLTLAGWALGWRLLTAPPPAFIPMAPTTALAFLLLGGGVLGVGSARLGARRGALIAASLVLVLAVLSFLARTGAMSWAPDQLFPRVRGSFGAVPLGVMSPVTAACLVVAAAGVGALALRPHARAAPTAGALGLAAAVAGAVVALGYLYGTPLLYGTRTVPVALTTGLSLLLLGLATVSEAGVKVWPLRPLLGDTSRARLLRRFLPATVLLVVAVGWADARIVSQAAPNSRALWSAWLVVAAALGVAALVYRISAGIGGALDHTVGELRRTEERLRRLAALVEAADDAILGITPEGVVVTCNPAAERLYGYSAREIAGRPLSQLLPPEHPEILAGLLERMRRGEHPPAVETTCVRRGGSRAAVSLRVSPIVDEAGGVVGASAIARDVTERRSLEAQLHQSQKMDAVGRLAAGVAHDFNNVLTTVFASSDLLLSELDEDSRLRRDVEEIRKAAGHAAQLTRQLLTVSRKQQVSPQVIRLTDVLRDMETMIKRTIREDIALTVATDPAAAPVRVDPGQMQQVILNLVINARDAMPSGGRLAIEVRGAELDDAYAASRPEVTAGPHVVLAVSDDGVGMDEATRSRVFEPFFTTKPPGQGTGLGLSTVYGIVRQSGGHVTVYSEPGSGTTIRVYLPVAEEAGVERVRAPEPRSDKPSGGGETILVVEDEPALRGTISRTLRFFGYRVLVAGNGAEALLVAAAHAGPIHLVLSDSFLPGMPAGEVAERLAAARPESRLLRMSGYSREDMEGLGLLSDGTPFIGKPFTAQELAQKVRDTLDASGPRTEGGRS
jgi:PAS domain S-box-containing protein